MCACILRLQIDHRRLPTVTDAYEAVSDLVWECPLQVYVQFTSPAEAKRAAKELIKDRDGANFKDRHISIWRVRAPVMSRTGAGACSE